MPERPFFGVGFGKSLGESYDGLNHARSHRANHQVIDENLNRE
jgi:hypothetical protein